jgi:hypothetical protein
MRILYDANSFGAILGVNAGVGALQTISSMDSEGRAIRAQSNYERRMLELQRINAEDRKADAIDRGRFAEAQQRQQTSQAIGAQRAAAFAGGGVGGSASDVIAETAELGALDRLALRENAMRAGGIQNEIRGIEAAKRMTKVAARNKSRATLATGGMKLANEASNYAVQKYRYDHPQEFR